MFELERYIMEQIGIHKGLLHNDTIEQSQRADKLINERMKLKGVMLK